MAEENREIVVIDETTMKSKIYYIRNQKVMLDFELAEIYGYETKTFNQQVKNNIEKFDEDFRFQLTKDEWEFLRSKILTSKILKHPSNPIFITPTIKIRLILHRFRLNDIRKL